VAEGSYRLEGALDFATVPSLWRESQASFATGASLEVDLGGVTRADSAGLALMLEWHRTARGSGGGVRFRNLPAQLRAIARAVRLEALFA
jgi:phospholipid transport system transporter-binding protein